MSLLLLKELIIIFLFVVTAAGVVPRGIPKKRPQGGCTGLVVRASDSGSGDPGSILGRVGVLFP